MLSNSPLRSPSAPYPHHKGKKNKSERKKKQVSTLKNIRSLLSSTATPKASARLASRNAFTVLLNGRTSAQLAFTSFVVNMAIEMYPAMPRYNGYIALMFLWISVSIKDDWDDGNINDERSWSVGNGSRRNNQPGVMEDDGELSTMDLPKTKKTTMKRHFLIKVLSVIGLSLFLDLDWLIASETPISLLNEQSSATANIVKIAPNSISTVSSIALVSNMGLKLLILARILQSSKRGRSLLRKLWQSTRYFLPTIHVPSNTNKLRRVIERRAIALGWLHLVCSLILGMTTLITIQTLYYSNIFTAGGSTLLPLNVTMTAKAVSSFVIFLAWFRNIDGGEFLSTLGCLSSFEVGKRWYEKRKKRLRAKRGFSAPKVAFESEYFSLNMIVKVVDFVIGLLVWVGIGRANNRSQTKSVRMVIAVVTGCQLVTDVLGPVLTFLVVYFFRIWVDKSEVGEEDESSDSEDSDDSDSDDDSDSSSEDDDDDDDEDEDDDESDTSSLNDSQSAYYDQPPPSPHVQQQPYFDGAAATFRAAHDTQLQHSHYLQQRPQILDQLVSCSPRDFSRLWDSLPLHEQFECETSETPLLHTLTAHFTSNNFFVVASGVVDEGTMKFYLCAQKEGVKCLVEMTFDTARNKLNLGFKVEGGQVSLLGVFVSCMGLKNVFGDFIEKNVATR